MLKSKDTKKQSAVFNRVVQLTVTANMSSVQDEFIGNSHRISKFVTKYNSDKTNAKCACGVSVFI